MSDLVPELFAEGCNNELPAWGVTRQFDFGQFVILYDERVINGKRIVTPVVLSDEGDIVVPAAATGSGGTTKSSASAVAATGGVPLQLLYETEDAPALVTSVNPTSVQVDDVGSFLQSGAITVEDSTYSANLPLDAKAAIASGRPVTVIGMLAEEGQDEQRALIRFVPSVRVVDVSADELNELIAERTIEVDGETLELSLTSESVEEAMAGEDVVVAASRDGGNPKLIRLRPQMEEARPAGTRFVVRSAASFLAAPAVPSTGRGDLDVELTAEAVRTLRTEGRAVVDVGGVGVEVLVGREGRTTWPEIDGITEDPDLGSLPTGTTPYPDDGGTIPGTIPGTGGLPGTNGRVKPWEWHPLFEGAFGPFERFVEYDGGVQSIQPGATTPDTIIPRKGLQLAILLPWQQLWKLDGFSRGSLISSIALAPLEETMITVASWERRAKALEQSTETDIDQQVDFTQTTRDTDDVFRELTSRHDFQWQVHGNVDASYSNGVASIRVGVDGGVNNTQSLASVLRTTHNHLRETTNKASTRVRSKRITKISESIERGVSQEVVRRIRNANESRTLTLDFHEVLAHYTIQTKFIAPRVRIVVLIPNPISVDGFTALLVRKNETALRNALLDSALADAFEACRLLTSYEFAKQELREVAAAAKEVEELDKPRETPPATSPKPKNPHEAKVLSLLGDIAAVAGQLQSADIGPALSSIRTHTTVTEAQRSAGQRWMFVRLCQSKIAPVFVNALFGLVGKQPSIAEAQRFIDAAPKSGAYPSLGDLNDLPDTDKEQAGLDIRIKSQPGYVFWDWGWWTGRCREERLYRADDGGLANKLDRLQQAWQDYQAKASEGEGIEAGNQLVQSAQQEQDEANYADKLEMKYGLEVVASARERLEALLGHLNDHLDYYRYVLFQALPPGEQLRRLMDVAPQLRVGMFEPHVVAMNGPFLAVPLTPLGESKLERTLTTLQNVLETAGTEAEDAAEEMADNTVILPTPGLSVEAWLGRCDALESQLQELRTAEGRRVAAVARRAELEGDRMAARLDATPPQLDDPSPDTVPVVNVRIDQPE